MSEITINDILLEIKKIEIRLIQMKNEIKNLKPKMIDVSFDFDCGQKLKEMEIDGFIYPSILKQVFGRLGVDIAKNHGYSSKIYWDPNQKKTVRAYYAGKIK